MASPPETPPGAPPASSPGRAATLRSSFRYAFAGLGFVARSQRNFRIHLAAGALATILALALGFTTVELAVLAGIITLVLTSEMLNTVVEAAVDLASPGYHPLAKIAKDVAAGAVLVTALGAVAAGLFLFIPHLIHWWAPTP
ncbi:MAG TPA: diacylglycerol kinase family protein [Chloroflexia bacterium]|nr:diacylglycerol kinase family protein [Chloroflexia bacterium]